MDDATRAALEASIEHWKEIAAGQSTDTSGEACALCMMFRHDNDLCGGRPVALRSGMALCGGCPVALRSGMALCGNTPYRNVYDAKIKMLARPRNKVVLEAFRVAAEEEVAFLESLREGT